MVRELAPIDIAQIPELARLVNEVRVTRRPRVLTDRGTGVAMLLPLDHVQAPRLPLPRLPKGGVIAATAGMLASDMPALSAEEERAAFEQAVADEGQEGLGG